MKQLFLGAALAVSAAFPAFADEGALIRRESDAGVSETVGRLVTAIEGAGARVMAQIDHGAGAKSVGQDIGESQLVIFGNPKAGTPVMEKNRLAGLIVTGAKTPCFNESTAWRYCPHLMKEVAHAGRRGPGEG